MKTLCLSLWLSWSFVAWAQDAAPAAQPAAQPAAAPAASPAPPPAAAAKLSAAELEKLVETIAIYPDPLIASILPASVYPLEIVQAARFVADTNNLAKLDEQPWDDNVKAVARVPQVLKQMNDNLPWTMQLGEAFLAQDKDVMDAIQSLRMKAQKAGTLRTTEQQIVVVTNTIVETVVQQQPVIVTNTIVQVVPTNPEIVYVPTYVPSAVYYPPPAYVYDPYAPLVTFGAGIAVGVILANGCDWHHGGCYHGGYYGGYYHGGDHHGNKYKGDTTKIKVEGDVNVGSGNRGDVGSGNRGERPTQQGGAGQKWQPSQSRLGSSGARGTSPTTQEARGWGSGSGAAGTRPSTGAVGSRPSTGTSPKPSTGAVGSRPSTGTTPSARPSTTPSTQRPSATAPSTRPTSPSTGSRPASSQASSRPSTSQSSAFSTSSSGSSVRSDSNRGSASRSAPARSSGGSRGGGGGGGGRGGGGGGGRR